MNTWIAIGVMSGTSVDGLDIAAIKFRFDNDRWQFETIKAVSVDYGNDLRDRLIHCIHASGEELVLLDLELGRFIGQSVSDFLKDEDLKIDLVASHGHTVYHQPDKGMTKQIGDGQSILLKTGILTINDFRTIDVIKGGQGAPLVPIGDQQLFPEYDVCLNIGGFANISFNHLDGSRMAFDTGPANLLLNHLARKIGHSFDANGDIARKGKCIPEMLDSLNVLAYYKLPPPKSLGLEWVEKNIFSKLEDNKFTVEDLLHTCVKHIAFQINQAIINVTGRLLDKAGQINILVTGGGSHNQFLMANLQKDYHKLKYILPDKEIVDYKEAIIFAFLGVLRLNKQINILSSVTGAGSNSIGGTIHDNL